MLSFQFFYSVQTPVIMISVIHCLYLLTLLNGTVSSLGINERFNSVTLMPTCLFSNTH